MSRNEIINYWTNEDNDLIAEVPELPGCMAHGKSYEKADENISNHRCYFCSRCVYIPVVV